MIKRLRKKSNEEIFRDFLDSLNIFKIEKGDFIGKVLMTTQSFEHKLLKNVVLELGKQRVSSETPMAISSKVKNITVPKESNRYGTNVSTKLKASQLSL